MPQHGFARAAASALLTAPRVLRAHPLYAPRCSLPCSYMSLHNFGQAHYYALSMQHELAVMASIVEAAHDNVVTSLRCGTPASSSWSYLATSSVALAGLTLLGAGAAAARAKGPKIN